MYTWFLCCKSKCIKCACLTRCLVFHKTHVIHNNLSMRTMLKLPVTKLPYRHVLYLSIYIYIDLKWCDSTGSDLSPLERLLLICNTWICEQNVRADTQHTDRLTDNTWSTRQLKTKIVFLLLLYWCHFNISTVPGQWLEVAHYTYVHYI